MSGLSFYGLSGYGKTIPVPVKGPKSNFTQLTPRLINLIQSLEVSVRDALVVSGQLCRFPTDLLELGLQSLSADIQVLSMPKGLPDGNEDYSGEIPRVLGDLNEVINTYLADDEREVKVFLVFGSEDLELCFSFIQNTNPKCKEQLLVLVPLGLSRARKGI